MRIVPSQVRRLAAALDHRGGRHLYVSSVSAYAPAIGPDHDETAALNPAPDPPTEVVEASTYGPLKAECERVAEQLYGDRQRVAEQLYGDRLTVVRPSYVTGPYDPTGRFPWWVDRIARGGHVRAPGPQDAPFQAVDGRDLARFMVQLLQTGCTGAYHAAAPRPPYSFFDMLADIAAAVAPKGTHLTWVDAEWLIDRRLDGRMLPMWDEQGPDWNLAVDPRKAQDAGFEARSLSESARDTLSWLHRGGSLREGIGLDAAREATILEEWQ